MTVQL